VFRVSALAVLFVWPRFLPVAFFTVDISAISALR
jgi:hypothetical protein